MRQSGQVKHSRRVSRSAQGAEGGGVREGVSAGENFGAVFKLDLTEETRTQLQDRGGGSCLLLPHTGYAYVNFWSLL